MEGLMKITITQVTGGYVVRMYEEGSNIPIITRELPSRLCVEMFLKALEW